MLENINLHRKKINMHIVYQEKQKGSLAKASFRENTQQITNQEVSNSRVFASKKRHNLYMDNMQVVIKCLFNRSLTDSSYPLIFYILFHCDVCTRFNIGLVSKAFHDVVATANEEYSYKPLIKRAAISFKSNKGELRNITPDMINKLPLYDYLGKIEIVSLPDQITCAVQALTKENLLGFDTETRPAFKKGEVYLPSLIQLATADKVYIFQLHFINKLPSTKRLTFFAPLFENPQIIKAGVGIENDIKQLQTMGFFNPQGFIEISNMEGCRCISNKGLRGLAAIVLEVRISKTMQKSNWSNKKLSDPQINYAATDAWISRELYVKLGVSK